MASDGRALTPVEEHAMQSTRQEPHLEREGVEGGLGLRQGQVALAAELSHGPSVSFGAGVCEGDQGRPRISGGRGGGGAAGVPGSSLLLPLFCSLFQPQKRKEQRNRTHPTICASDTEKNKQQRTIWNEMRKKKSRI